MLPWLIKTVLVLSSYFLSEILPFWKLKVIEITSLVFMSSNVYGAYWFAKQALFTSEISFHQLFIRALFSLQFSRWRAGSPEWLKKKKKPTSLRPQLKRGWTGFNPPHLIPQSVLLPVTPPQSLWQLSLTAGKISHGPSSLLCKNIRDKRFLIPKWLWPLRLPQKEVSSGKVAQLTAIRTSLVRQVFISRQ